jgi:hypothetical protein
MLLSRCQRSKQPMLDVRSPSHDLQGLVDLLQQSSVRDFQLVINQGSCQRQFRSALQVRMKRMADLDRFMLVTARSMLKLLPAAGDDDDDDMDITVDGEAAAAVFDASVTAPI